MIDLIDRQAAIDALIERKIERKPSGINSALEIIKELPSAQTEVTEEEVKEYCRKRCLCIVDSALIKKYESEQPEQRTPCHENLKRKNDELKAHIEYLSRQVECMKGEIKALAYSVRCNGVSGNEVPYEHVDRR